MADSAFTVVGSVNAPAPTLARAWGYFTVSAGVYTLQDSYNVASIAKLATGQLQITLTDPFASANYSFAFGIQSAGNEFWQTQMNTQLAGSFRMFMADATNFYADPAAGSFICFGN
jgi:hypothetical protein